MTDDSANHATFAFDVAPYLLGALSTGDSEAFERHSAACVHCQSELAQAGLLADRLLRLDEHAFDSVPAPPDTLLPRLLREVDRERRRTTRRTRVVLAVAACLAALLGAVAVPRLLDRPAAQLALHATSADVPVHAAVRLVNDGKSTRVDLSCHYDEASPYGVLEYQLVVTSRSGEHSTVSHWTIGPGGSVDLQAEAPWPKDQLRHVSLQTANGREVLALDL